MAQVRVIPNMKRRIVHARKSDVKLQEIVQLVNARDKTNYAIYGNESFWYGGIVPLSLLFRKNFEDEIYFKGRGGGGGGGGGGRRRIVTPQNIP